MLCGMRPALLLAAVAILALGLWADIHVDLPGQLAIGAVVWALTLALLAPLPAAERRFYLACIGIATAGELFLSLVWGLYTYRLENVPLFVPPGHVMLLMMAIGLGRSMPYTMANVTLAAAAAYGLIAGILGFDTFGSCWSRSSPQSHSTHPT